MSDREFTRAELDQLFIRWQQIPNGRDVFAYIFGIMEAMATSTVGDPERRAAAQHIMAAIERHVAAIELGRIA